MSNLCTVRIGIKATYRYLFKNLNIRKLVVHNECIMSGGVCDNTDVMYIEYNTDSMLEKWEKIKQGWDVGRG